MRAFGVGNAKDDATTRLVSPLEWFEPNQPLPGHVEEQGRVDQQCGHRNRVPDGLSPASSTGSRGRLCRRHFHQGLERRYRFSSLRQTVETYEEQRP